MDPNQTSNQTNNSMSTPPVSSPMNSVPQQSVAPAHDHDASTGTWIAAVVILAAIVVGGFYFWNQRGMPVDQGVNDTQLEGITAQSTSDTAASIDADLDSTDVDNLDAELNAS